MVSLGAFRLPKDQKTVQKVIPSLRKWEFKKAYEDVPIEFSKEEIDVIPDLRQFIAVMLFYAIRGIDFDFSNVRHEPSYWRNDVVIPYYKKFIHNSLTVYLMERVLEKQFWNVKKRHSKLTKKQIINFIIHDLYADVMTMSPNKRDLGSHVPHHKVFSAYYTPLYPFPNINLSKYVHDLSASQIAARLNKICGYYEGGQHWDGETTFK